MDWAWRANLATTPAGRDVAARAGVRIVPGVIANIGGAGAAALAATRVAPFGLPADARDLFDLTDTEPLAVLNTLLLHRRAERDQLISTASDI